MDPNLFIDFDISSFLGSSLFKMSQFVKSKTSPILTPYYSIEHAGNMLYESFKDPSRPAARQHMRQHGKFEKIRSKNSSYERVVRSFSGNFPEASRSIFCHPFNVF